MSFFKNKIFATFLVILSGLLFLSPVKAAVLSSDSAGKVNIEYYYALKGRLKSGTASLTYENNGAKNGYDFLNRQYTGASNGAFYATVTNGVLYFYGNNIGQGGIYQLRSLSSSMPSASRVGYNRFGVEVKKNGVYAVYDSKNNVYIKVRVTNVINTYNPPVSNIGQAVITSPSQNQVFYNLPRTVNVTWNLLNNAQRYEIKVDCDSCGNQTGWNYWQTFYADGNSLNITVPEDKNYRIQVRGLSTVYNRQGDWSDYTYFRLDTGFGGGDSNVGIPAINLPTNGKVLVDYPRTLAVGWSRVNNAAKYNIQIDCNLCNNKTGWAVIASTTVDAPNNYVSNLFTLPFDSEYRLRVQTVDQNGRIGNWSDYNYFRFTTVNLPTPTISYPTNEQNFSASNHAINVGWNRVNNAIGYSVEVNYGGSNWSKVMYFETTDPVNYLNNINVTTDANQRVRVQAIDRWGNRSPWSAYVNFHFTDGGNGNSNINAPVITSPYQNQNFTNRSININWNTVIAASRYEITVDCDSCNNQSGWRNYGVYFAYNSGSFSITLLEDKNYSVRIRSVDSNGMYSAYSNTINFSLNGNNAASTPTILSPQNNVTVNTANQNLYISWTPVANARAYTVAVVCETCTNKPWVMNTVKNQTYFSLPINTLEKGNNQFKILVRSFTTDDDYQIMLLNNEWVRSLIVSNVSTPVYFWHNNSYSLNTPTITNPTNNQMYNGRVINFAWTRVTNATKYNVEVSYGSSWQFTSVFTTNDPVNYLSNITLTNDVYQRVRVQAVDQWGSKSSWSDYVYFNISSVGSASNTATIIKPLNYSTIDSAKLTVLDIELKSTSSTPAYSIAVICETCQNQSWTFFTMTTYPFYTLRFERLPETNKNNRYKILARPLYTDDLNLINSQNQAWMLGGNVSNVSDPAYFYTSSVSSLATPVITSPANNQNIYNERKLNLSWTRVNGAVGYYIRMDDGDENLWRGNFPGFIVYDPVNYLNNIYFNSNNPRIRIRTIGKDNTTSAWSDWMQFNFVQP